MPACRQAGRKCSLAQYIISFTFVKRRMARKIAKGIKAARGKNLPKKGELRAIISQSFGRNVVGRASGEPVADHFAKTRQFPEPGLPAPVIERQIQKVQRPLERLVAVGRIILGFQARPQHLLLPPVPAANCRRAPTIGVLFYASRRKRKNPSRGPGFCLPESSFCG